MPKLRIRKPRKIVVKNPGLVQPAPPAPAPPPAASPARTVHVPPNMTLAEYSVRIGAQRLREQKAQARAEAAAKEAAKEAARQAGGSETSPSTDYVTPVSSQDDPSQRGPLQPTTYFQQLYDAKTPYFDGPHIPKGIREREPWIARDPPNPEPGQRQRFRHRRRRRTKKTSVTQPLSLCDNDTCDHGYCYFSKLHQHDPKPVWP
ncbi:hypothetical protein CJU90_4388 [Yarrowia sp. C11]|nr:hypothetical protein CKK34_6670 [Yarrowia sp. E02]KAG5365319.1 hypothetical protein CJU90_4388 [Yarrowia sp. C11]